MSFVLDTIANRLNVTNPSRWVVTGAAGFVGSNLVEALLLLGQHVTAADDFSSGSLSNLEAVANALGRERCLRMHIVECDIANLTSCMQVCETAEYVLHQAARTSVPGSIDAPVATHNTNATGFLNMLVAAQSSGVKKFVYASSSAVYGDGRVACSSEDDAIAPTSPYAATKAANETYATVFSSCYDASCIGLRYFNVFGPRERHVGFHVPVIPNWICTMMRGEPNVINGDGESSRDYCFVDDVVRANLLAATTRRDVAKSQIYNVASGRTTTLNQLNVLLRAAISSAMPKLFIPEAQRTGFRNGDIRHSRADISKARALLGFEAETHLPTALLQTVRWHQTQKFS